MGKGIDCHAGGQVVSRCGTEKHILTEENPLLCGVKSTWEKELSPRGWQVAEMNFFSNVCRTSNSFLWDH